MRLKTDEQADEELEGHNRERTKHSCIVEAHESTRQRLDSSPLKDHEYHIAGKGYISISHCNLVHKFIPKPQAIKIPDAKAAVEKGMAEAQNNYSVAVDSVKSKKRKLFSKHKETKNKSTLLH